MTNSNYQRWSELVDRKAVGDELSSEEEAFCRDFAEHNPLCQRENAFWKELGTINEEPNDTTRAIVDGVLATTENEAAQKQDVLSEQPEIPFIKRNRLPLKWLAGALVAASCVALVGVWLNFQEPQHSESVVTGDTGLPRIELVYASGQVQVNEYAIKVGDVLLKPGDIIETLDGQACVAIDPGIDVCQGKSSRLRISETSTKTRRIELLAGGVTVSLAPQPRGMSFSVVAADTVVTAVGTVFSVEFTDDAKGIEAAVLAGKVSVKKKSDGRIIHAHQRAIIRDAEPRVTPILRADESQYWALVQNIKLWKGPATSVLDLCNVPAGATIVLNGQPIGTAPLSSLIPAGTHRIELKIGEQTVLNEPFSSQAGEVVHRDLDVQSAARTRFEETKEESHAADNREVNVKVEPTNYQNRLTTSSHSEAGEFIAIARHYMQQSRWLEAALAYRELLQDHPRSAEAHTVLVPLAQLELEHLQQPKLALKDLELYARQGGGALSQEAHFTRIRALQKLGRNSQEINAIEEFLERYPSSFETKILRHRLASLTSEDR
jgi:hypothetical protein